MLAIALSIVWRGRGEPRLGQGAAEQMQTPSKTVERTTAGFDAVFRSFYEVVHEPVLAAVEAGAQRCYCSDGGGRVACAISAADGA